MIWRDRTPDADGASVHPGRFWISSSNTKVRSVMSLESLRTERKLDATKFGSNLHDVSHFVLSNYISGEHNTVINCSHTDHLIE